MTINYSTAREHPLVTDELIEQRVSDLVGRACRRQLWLLFLDENDVQLPLLMPTDDFATRPDPAYVEALVRGIKAVMETAGAVQLIVVWERYSGPELTPLDKAWARDVGAGCAREGVLVRAQLLSYKRGVRWIAPDDYLA